MAREESPRRIAACLHACAGMTTKELLSKPRGWIGAQFLEGQQAMEIIHRAAAHLQPTGFECPDCGEGRMASRVIPEHSTMLGGMPLIVKKAEVYECDHCGGTTVMAKELRRWRAIQNRQMAAETPE